MESFLEADNNISKSLFGGAAHSYRGGGVGGSLDPTERSKVTKEQAEQIRFEKKNKILSKIQEKEELFKSRENERMMQKLVN